MRLSVFIVYYDDEIDKIFLSQKKALDYKENLEIYTFDNNVSIKLEKRYIYV